MGKNVIIQVPCAHLQAGAIKPGDDTLTMHFVPVPEEALAEVQEVLKKYQPQIEKFNELLGRAVKEQKDIKVK